MTEKSNKKPMESTQTTMGIARQERNKAVKLVIPRPTNIKNDILAGLTTVLTMVPEAVAFTFVAGIDPMIGLYGAFFTGLITALFGGRPGMITGAAGAMAVVTTAFITMFGLEYLFAAIIVTGIIQVLVGIFKLGKFIRLMPHPVMLGFVNGLAIVIGWAQFNQFKENTRVVYDTAHQSFTYTGDWMALTDPRLLTMIAIIIVTMLIIHFLPKLTKALPAPLVAIAVCTSIVALTPIESKTISEVVKVQRTLTREKNLKVEQFNKIKGDTPFGKLTTTGEALAIKPITEAEYNAAGYEAVKEGLEGSLPSFHIPQIEWTNFSHWKKILVLAFILSAVGLIESLMTMSLIDDITETRGQGNRECMGQGAGNIISGLFGGMCGCAMIGQSMINVNSGGRGRLSGVSTALFLLAFILFAPGLLEMIPVASLIGVMFMVVIATFEWSSLRLFGRIPKSDIFIIILVSAITVMVDLAIAVGIGIVVSTLIYAWKRNSEVTKEKTATDDSSCTYAINGNLFFGSVVSFRELFNPKEDPVNVYLDFQNSRVCDHSALDAVHGLSEKYADIGKKLHLKHLSPECSELLKKAGDIVEVNINEDPVYHVADDRLD